MKVLYFTKYTRQGASSRLRSYQYFPKLEEQGFHVKVSPLFNDKYLDQVYTGKTPKLLVVLAYLRRFIAVFEVSSYDKVIIEKELFPYLPAWCERVFKTFNINFIVDYDDAIFHNYDRHPNTWIRKFLGDKIDKVMKYSNCVIAGNSYLGDRAIKVGATQVEIIPTVIDLKRYNKDEHEQSSSKIIGWIGSPSTFKYVKQIEEVLKKIVEVYNVSIHIIGSGKEKLGFDKNITYLSWTETSEVNEISKFDIGIMPLEDSDWEKGKCSYKLIQYMACKKSVVASAVGMNKEVIENGINGFLVDSNEEWFEKLSFYINNTEVAQKHGQEGYGLIKKKYNLNFASQKLISILNSL